MKKESTIDGFQNIDSMSEYLKKVLEEKDLDGFLRVCAIEEKTENYPFTSLMKTRSPKRFSYKYAYLPSAKYDEYSPVNTMLITNDFVDQYNQLFEQTSENLKKKKNHIIIKNIRILLPSQQLEGEFLEKLKTKSDLWGCDYLVQMAATISVNGKDYIFGYSVAKYDGYYKLFNLKADLLDWDSDMYAVEKKDVDSAVFSDAYNHDEFISKMEKHFAKDTVVEKEEKDADPETAVLPLNYMILDQEYGSTPGETINAFLIELMRNNPAKALTYCNMPDASNDTLEDSILRQGDMALQLSYLYKGLYGLPYSKILGIKYEYLGFTVNDVASKLDPENIHTMSVLSLKEVSYGNEYYGIISFNQSTYKIGFTLSKSDKGWQIDSLSAHSIGINEGEVLSPIDILMTN